MSRRVCIVAVVAALTCALGACVGELVPLEPAGGSDDDGALPGPDAGVSTRGTHETYFVDNVQPLLQKSRPRGACAQCHQGNSPADGPDFLGPSSASNYLSLLTTTLVTGTPSTSRLVTIGLHTGDAFESDERVIVEAWIRLEAP